MAIQIRTTGFDEFIDPSGGAYIKALISGEHGVGKTPSAACWPKPIFADCEDGLMSVASKAVPYARIRSTADMDSLLAHLRRDSIKPADKREYQTIVLDTIDSYQRAAIQERLRLERKEAFAGFADWGWLESKMNLLIESLLNLKMNVVVNMHTKMAGGGDDDGPRIEIPRLKGDIKDSIFQEFDLIGRMEKSYVSEGGERVEKRQIRWHSEPRFPNLRDRSGRLPKFTDVDFVDDFQRIQDAIMPALDEMPESKVLDTLAVDGDDAPPVNENLEGGPVANVTAPAAPKKKTPAKKAPAAKKAAAPAPAQPEPPAPTPAADAEPAAPAGPEAESPWGPPAEWSGPNAQPPGDNLAEAEKLVTEELGATKVEEPVTVPTTSEGLPKKAAAPATGARVCGSQPPAMVKKGTAALHKGCGVELTKENAGEAAMSMLKTKAYLCNGCWDAYKSAA